MADMVRVLVHDHTDAFLCELEPPQVMDLRSVEEVNGEHSLTIVTTQELEKTNRLLVRDARGYWHEYVVLGIESEHSDGGAIFHEYYCVWSLQYDLSATFIDDQFGCGVVPGHASIPQTPTKGLQCALEGTTRWTIGTVSVTTMAAASFYRRSGWEGLQTVVEKWGGELHATITVGDGGVTARAVDLLAHEGSATPTRRFDYGHDVVGIKKTISDAIWPCRIVPLGASQETEAGGYTRRPSIESVNGGVMWLQDDDMVPYTRVPDGNGGWEYPTLIVTNDTYEEPADLKAWALDAITDYTKPIVSYEAEVAQFVQAGMDAHGVSLGDEIVVVDRTFGSDGLEISARVVKVEQSLLDTSDVRLTIGNALETLSGQLASIAKGLEDIADGVASAWQYQGSSAEWVSNLLTRINAEANATGGYTYITEGQGIRCYDVAVSDPLVGAEASAACEIKGGTMRIANTKDAGGNWEWKTVFTSGRILAELIDAIGASSGYHAQLTPTGLDVYDGSTLVAHFGATAQLGDASDLHAEMDSNGFAMMDDTQDIVRLSGSIDAAGRYNGTVQVGGTDRGYTRYKGTSEDVDYSTYTLTRNKAELQAIASGGEIATVTTWSEVTDEQTPTIESGVRLYGEYLNLAYDTTYGSTLMVDAVKAVAARSGSVGQTISVPANGYVEYPSSSTVVSFGTTYDSAPHVVVSLYSTSTAATFGGLSIAVSYVSTTGFRVRIYNSTSTARTPGFHWIAMP